MKSKLIIVSMIVILLLSACAQPSAVVETTPTSAPPTAAPLPTTPSTAVYPPPPTAAPTQSTGGAYPPPTQSTNGAYPPPSGNLTPSQSAAIQAASDKYSIPVDQFTVISTEAVTWPDGCLGVVIPGVMCTDVVTDGYRIILEANGRQFEYHTNLDGTSVIDASQLQATLGFVVSGADGTLEVVNPNIPLGPTYNPAFTGFLSAGGSANSVGYVYDGKQFMDFAIDSSGTSAVLSFITKPTYGLAVWPGSTTGMAMLAWGTQIDATHPSSLQISALDGSNLETLLTLDAGATPPQALVADFWSTDGKTLYFSKEPVGIGGYIPFTGGSNLFKIDIASKAVSEIIPVSAANGPQVCLDALSLDFRYVADHCTQGVITIRDLQLGGSVTIQTPAGIADAQQQGSARFSPDGKQVAYALAKGNPDEEQGWVALGASSGGPAKAILTGKTGYYYTVIGWLDDQTILVQTNPVGCTDCTSEVYTLSTDGTAFNKVADGFFLTVIDNR